MHRWGCTFSKLSEPPKRPPERTNPHSFGGVPMIGLIVTALLQTFCALDQEDDSGYAFHCGEAGGIAAATAAFGVRALELCDDISDAYEDSDLDFMRYILRYTPTPLHPRRRRLFIRGHRDRRSRPGILSSPGLGIPTTGTRPTGTRRHSPPRRRHHGHTRFHILHHRRPPISRPPKARRQNENRRCKATESSQIRGPPELVFRRFS